MSINEMQDSQLSNDSLDIVRDIEETERKLRVIPFDRKLGFLLDDIEERNERTARVSDYRAQIAAFGEIVDYQHNPAKPKIVYTAGQRWHGLTSPLDCEE